MTIVDFVRLMRRNLVLLLAFMCVGIAIGAVYVFTRPVQYVAEATAMIVAGDSTTVGSVSTGDTVASSRANTYVSLIGTQAIQDRVTASLEEKGNPGARAGSIDAKVLSDTPFIRLTATGSSAQNAQDLANAALDALMKEALRIETYVVPGSENMSDEERADLTTVRVLGYEPAALPSTPVRIPATQWIPLSAGIGLAIGMAFVLLRRQMDVKVRSADEAEKLTGKSVLGIIPATSDLRKQRGKGALTSLGNAGEAFRQLRTNLRFTNIDNPPRVVVITSANPGEGKSTVSTNLAHLLARSGEDVILVDCDLRKPMQAEAFGVDNHVGLTQALIGDVDVEDALVQTEIPRLRLLPSGRIPPNPSELVGSRRMQEIIDKLAKKAFVILDAPPMLAVTDGRLLAVQSDGAILVSVVGKTEKAAIELCASQLAQVNAVMLGVVLNKASSAAMSEVVYGYGYGYGKRYGYGGYEYGKKKSLFRKRSKVEAIEQSEEQLAEGVVVEAAEGRRGAVANDAGTSGSPRRATQS